jgi:hypothetical protein
MHILMMFLASSIHMAVLIASLKSACIGTTMGAWPGVVALAVTVRLGDVSASEFGGEPTPAVLTCTRDPQLNVPGSEGGVNVGIVRSNRVLIAVGLPWGDSVAASARQD